MLSKVRPQSSQTNLPFTSCAGGPVWPERKRCEQAEQSVAGPSGPRLLFWHSSALQWHHAHCQMPPSQKRLWPPSELIVGKPRRHLSQIHSPLSFCVGRPLWPAR